MRSFSYIVLVVVVALITGCTKNSKDNVVVGGGNPSGGDSTKTRAITVRANGLLPLRSGESYWLWIKYPPDTTVWHPIKQLVPTFYANDITTIFFYVKEPAWIDSVTSALISIEQPSVADTPRLPLLQGIFNTDSAYHQAQITASALGNFGGLSASLVFTTFSSDTTAYPKEFYLCQYDGKNYVNGMTGLPPCPSGWAYGLWAIDSSNSPTQITYYGLFTADSGHDSYTYNDTLTDNLAFPGGAELAPMNRKTGSIIVTLEPDWYGNAVRTKGPTPFTLLTFSRTQFISARHTYPMTNVARFGIPYGSVTITKQ